MGAGLTQRAWLGGADTVGTHGLALLQHGKHEENVAVAGLQASVVKAAVLLLVPGLEGGGQHGEASCDVGTGRLELARVPQAAPLQPGDVLDELRKQRRGLLRAGWIPGAQGGWDVSAPGRLGPGPHLLQVHVLRAAQWGQELAPARLAQRHHHNEVVPVTRGASEGRRL